MKSTEHSIYGRNGSISLLKSNKFSITEVFVMDDSPALKDKALRSEIKKNKSAQLS